MTDPDPPDDSSPDLEGLSTAVRWRRLRRSDPRRHYFEMRPILVLLEIIAWTGIGFVVGVFAVAVQSTIKSLGGSFQTQALGSSVLLGGAFAALVAAEIATGWTPGKGFASAKVRRADGSPADVGRLAIRFACKWAPAILYATAYVGDTWLQQRHIADWILLLSFFIAVVNFVSLMVSPITHRLTWYDFVSGTAVFDGRYLHELSGSQGRGFQVVTERVEEAQFAPKPDEPAREPDPQGLA